MFATVVETDGMSPGGSAASVRHSPCPEIGEDPRSSCRVDPLLDLAAIVVARLRSPHG
jgi:hypothetical protein